jgi:hypothetical protein
VSVPIDPGEFIQTISDGLRQIPGVVFAAVLLGGPTALWLLYRFIVVPRTSRYKPGVPHTLWVCPNCRSASEVHQVRCYRCGYERDSLRGLEIVYADPELEEGAVVTPAAEPYPGVPVGPGRPVIAATVATDDGYEPADDVVEATDGELDGQGMVPVGPATPVATPPRRLSVADRPVSRRGASSADAKTSDKLEGTAAATERPR